MAPAAPPSSAMNSRRRNLLNRICRSYASDGGKLQNIKLVGISQQVSRGLWLDAFLRWPVTQRLW
jgi:hypothetical protein